MHGFARFVVAVSLFAYFLARAASAAVINFESTPSGGIPVDDAPLTTPYNLVGGGTVRFFFDTNGNNELDTGVDVPAVFEALFASGSDTLGGFFNDTLGLTDTPNGGLNAQLGKYFLRQQQPGAPPPPFIVDYNTSQVIYGLTGEIWDIDDSPPATEQWLVEVLDASNNLMTSQLSPLGDNGALDGLPWVFSFTGLPSGVDKLRITFVGSKTSGLGLAFNNFNPLVPAPEPGSVVLLAIGGGALVLVRLKRIRRRSE